MFLKNPCHFVNTLKIIAAFLCFRDTDRDRNIDRDMDTDKDRDSDRDRETDRDRDRVKDTALTRNKTNFSVEQ